MKILILAIIGLLQFNNSFAYDFEVGGIYYNKISSTQVEVTYKSLENGKALDYSGEIYIPEKIYYDGNSYNVTVIGENAFIRCAEINKVNMPSSVTKISKWAFLGCGISSVDIPNSVTIIDAAAFADCSNLTTVTFGNSLKTINSNAFLDCPKLKSIIIPKSVKTIDELAFGNGSNAIESIIVEEGNSIFDSRNNCNAIIRKSNNELVLGCVNTIIPSTVKSIGNNSFGYCRDLKNIVIPNGVTTIGEHAFYYCTGLMSLAIPYSVTTIKLGAFQRCTNIETIDLGKNIQTIGEAAFSCCEKIKTLIIPKSVKSIGTNILDNNHLSSVIVESGNLYYDSRDNCNAIIETANNKLIAGCSNTIIPKTVTSICEYAFWDSKINSVTLPKNLTSIERCAFYKCEELPEIRIPKTVNNIGDYSFWGCKKLSKVISEINPPFDISRNVFEYSSANVLIVPKGTKNLYEACNGWNFFSKIVEETKLYTLTIMSTGSGTVSYEETTITNGSRTFSVEEEASVTVTFSPYNGYRIKSVKVDNVDVSASVSNNRYVVSNIQKNTIVEVVFEVISTTTYSLSISASGNGYASYDGTAIRGKTSSLTVNEGTSATIKFTPDNGYRIKIVKFNRTNVTSSVSANQYTIRNITANVTLEVEFVEDVKAFTVDGVNYNIVSQTEKIINVAGENYGRVLTIPATVTLNSSTWRVVGIEADALKGNTELAAIIWNPEVTFTTTVSNPNLLLYVKAEQYAPSAIQNVVVNGIASNIILTEAQSGNNFYCPQTFVAQKISYTHNYQMQTGLGESKGWETIALPFDVQTITHETKGTIVPFAQWNNESYNKPFWLMELTGNGFVEAGSIKAYTPYIISMPNHPQYESQWLLNGKVTFAASSVTVGKTEHLNQSVYNGRTFVPCFAGEKADEGFYALNVSNDWETNKSGMTEGCKFVLNMRQVHPFEAYMTSSSNAAQYFDVFDDMTTGIHQMVDGKWMMEKAVYDLQGRKVENPSKKGVYIVNGKKMIIK